MNATDTKDIDLVPRRAQLARCNAIENSGNRCRNLGTIEMYIWGDDSANPTATDGVMVVLCDEHAGRQIVKEADGAKE